jgi:hypothetical protein
MERLTAVAGWMWVVYFGLCFAGVWLAEGGSIFLLCIGVAVTLFGLVMAWRRATEAEPEYDLCPDDDEADPILVQLWAIKEWYRRNSDNMVQTQQLLEELRALTERLPHELEVPDTEIDGGSSPTKPDEIAGGDP